MDNKQTYTGISIGPIIATFSQVRKPRHLWSASYLFSHLMGIIIEEGEELAGEGTLISPAKDTEKQTGIGLYPDRAFFLGKIDVSILTKNVINHLYNEEYEEKKIIHDALKNIASDLSKETKRAIEADEKTLNSYFNIMGLCIESESESKAIGDLNQKLDALELSNRCEDGDARDIVLKLISKRKKSPLFKLGFGNENFDIEYLALIAAKELKTKSEKSEEEWNEIVKTIEKNNNDEIEKKTKAYYEAGFITKGEFLDFLDEADFYKQVAGKDELKKYFKSYHKYFCLVQADGDRMGCVIGNLQEGVLNKLSTSLISFGRAASKLVSDFNGLPIYAGGDDLLFIAPVVSKNGNIFDLIDQIDTEYNKVTEIAKSLQKGSDENKYKTSMSYGISINYYKYPLYEVLADARSLLFEDAKKYKNSIACRFRKHSGSSFSILLNKSKTDIKETFEKLIKIAVPNNMVSAVSHKLRENCALWQSTDGEEKRLQAFFEAFMGLEEKDTGQNNYLRTVKQVLEILLMERPKLLVTKMGDKEVIKSISQEINEYIQKNKLECWQFEQIKESVKEAAKEKIRQKVSKKVSEELNEAIYSMLRIAKFINGEEVKDE